MKFKRIVMMAIACTMFLAGCGNADNAEGGSLDLMAFE